MAVQCPRCELRFDLKPMLADHLETDHGAEPEVTDALQPPSLREGLRTPPAERAPGHGRGTDDADADADGRRR